MPKHSWFMTAVTCVLLTLAGQARAEKAAAADLAKAKEDPDFAIQGEYSGELNTDKGKAKFGIQVIALGEGKFHLVAYHGGLPGDGWDTSTTKVEADSKAEGGVVSFTNAEAGNATATYKDGGLVVTLPDNKDFGGRLEKVVRKSDTLGAKPPEGATVLFDGDKKVNGFDKEATDDGLLPQGSNSKAKFGSCTLHLEFMLPYEPKGRGQGRGNSGCYFQGRYEVQILDSFGLEGKNNECGGIYTISDPLVNMCFPALQWQTYDIDFTAAQFDASGKKTASARMTVKHNGVLVQKDVEVSRTTTAAPNKEGPEPGFLHLQDHGHPVRFRNIWVVEKKEK